MRGSNLKNKKTGRGLREGAFGVFSLFVSSSSSSCLFALRVVFWKQPGSVRFS